MNRRSIMKECGGAKASVLLATDSSSGAEMRGRRGTVANDSSSGAEMSRRTMVQIFCLLSLVLAPRLILIPT